MLRLKSIRQKSYSQLCVGKVPWTHVGSPGLLMPRYWKVLNTKWCYLPIPQPLAESFTVSLGVKAAQVVMKPCFITTPQHENQLTNTSENELHRTKAFLSSVMQRNLGRREREVGHALTLLLYSNYHTFTGLIQILWNLLYMSAITICFTGLEPSSSTGTQGITKHTADNLKGGQESRM